MLQDGKPVRTSDFSGKRVILFFYPQDNTPTCTEEVCNLRDHYQPLRKLGFDLYGISADSPKKHQNFIRKHRLPFPLISDTAKEFIKGFGVWGEKTTFGKTYDGIHRTTFVLDEQGVVMARVTEVHSKDHARQILEAIKQTT